jgi:uncharacterized protein YbcI
VEVTPPGEYVGFVEPGDLTTQRGGGSGSGELTAEISRSMVLLYKDLYGKGPTKARTYLTGDLLVCLLEGGLLAGERTLRDAGRGDAVVIQRETVQEVLRDRFVQTIEQLTGREVVTFISGADLQSETNAELFVLKPEQLDTRRRATP